MNPLPPPPPPEPTAAAPPTGAAPSRSGTACCPLSGFAHRRGGRYRVAALPRSVRPGASSQVALSRAWVRRRGGAPAWVARHPGPFGGAGSPAPAPAAPTPVLGAVGPWFGASPTLLESCAVWLCCRCRGLPPRYEHQAGICGTTLRSSSGASDVPARDAGEGA